MFRFQHDAPLDATPHVAPAEDDRSGPPLSQGFLFTMVGTVMAHRASPEVLALLARMDPDAWYEGQLLETLLNRFEAMDPALPQYIGRNIYFMWRSQLEALGFRTAGEVMAAVPALWKQVARGDSGEWRVAVGPQRAHLEAEQPYNCQFEAGTLVGLLEAYGATHVRLVHVPCRRSGAPFCVFEVRWDDGAASGGKPRPPPEARR
jgi:hypothetical protein